VYFQTLLKKTIACLINMLAKIITEESLYICIQVLQIFIFNSLKYRDACIMGLNQNERK
jgi:hypothetical protein